MIERLKRLIHRKPSFKKHQFKFTGYIPKKLPALVIFPEEKTPFFDSLTLFYSISMYHDKSLALLANDLVDAFTYHFPQTRYFIYGENIGQELRKFFSNEPPVVYLLSLHNDVFASFPERFSGSFDVALKRFSSHYNFLLDAEPESYKEFVNDFLKITGIENRVEEFKSKLKLKRGNSNIIFVDSGNPGILKGLKEIEDVVTVVRFEKYDFKFIGDRSFEEILKIALNSKLIIADDSIFTGYALHYQIPVYSENCEKYYKSPGCKSFKQLKL